MVVKVAKKSEMNQENYTLKKWKTIDRKIPKQ